MQVKKKKISPIGPFNHAFELQLLIDPCHRFTEFNGLREHGLHNIGRTRQVLCR